MKRRTFIHHSLALGAATCLPSFSTEAKETHLQHNRAGRSDFELWQLPSRIDTIGNSYVLRDCEGHIVVMDGGAKEEKEFLCGFLASLGNKVDAWIISHPHPDHIGALEQILKKPDGLRIERIMHSRFSERLIDAEPQCAAECRDFYRMLDEGRIPVTDWQEAGEEFTIGKIHLKVIGTTNHELWETNPYNNSSTIIRVWDNSKSILFLGDAGIECGDKALNGPFRDYLNADYVQMAHHGQNGCSREFYMSIQFRACLWPTPSWVWTNNAGKGYNTHVFQTIHVRNWMAEKGIKEHHVTCRDGLWHLK